MAREFGDIHSCSDAGVANGSVRYYPNLIILSRQGDCFTGKKVRLCLFEVSGGRPSTLILSFEAFLSVDFCSWVKKLAQSDRTRASTWYAPRKDRIVRTLLGNS